MRPVLEEKFEYVSRDLIPLMQSPVTRVGRGLYGRKCVERRQASIAVTNVASSNSL